MSTPDLSRAVWRKSSRSSNNGGQCVEVAVLPDAVAVRDSKHRDSAILLFTPAEWDAFITGVKDGEFDR